MSTVNLGFQVLPKMNPGESSYDAVDRAIDVVAQSGVSYVVGPMETVMEGELNHLLQIVKQAQDACIAAGAHEVMTHVKIHYRPDGGVTLDEKISKYRG
ncbi:thiamine-binding protein [Bacillaceae bacterium SIJ1]|uniref:thiamine-binding protein n=1 Tax=Litoribacterium kuwaitense TaxID=1398745 RepID=UPI0013EC8F60|nr:thiamine-binding protein [Litoribacterium kuwaitense]NGP46261.1 thiamine-binding protein [Litoribacterium kuwaitense]